MSASRTPYLDIAEQAEHLRRLFGLQPHDQLTWQVFGDRGANADGRPVVVNRPSGKPAARTFAARVANVAKRAALNCRNADFPNVYLALGLHDSPRQRKQETCRRVLAVALDLGACDWLAANRPAEFASSDEAKAHLHDLDDEALVEMLAEHQATAVTALAAAGLPAPSSWWCSGYGAYALYVLAGDDDGAADVELCRAINRDLVAALNGAVGYELADKAATNAGTHVLRVPGAYNVKSPTRPRACRVLSSDGPKYTATELRAAVPVLVPHQSAPARPAPRAAPVDHKGRLSDRQVALEALQILSPDMGHADWLTVGMALRSVSSDLLAAWDAWSAQSASKYKPGECESRWPGFRANHAGGVNIKRLVTMAQAIDPGFLKPGWRARRLREMTSQNPADIARQDAAGIKQNSGDGVSPPQSPECVADFSDYINGALSRADADPMPPWFADHLATVVTGGTVERRALFTNGAVYRAPVTAAVAVSSRTAGYARSDIADRTLPILTQELKDSQRASDDELAQAVNEACDGCWLAVRAARLLAVLPDAPHALPGRFVDFARLVWADARLDGCEGQAKSRLLALQQAQATLVGEGGPLLEAVLSMPMDQGCGCVRLHGSATEIARTLATNTDLHLAFHGNGRRIARELRELKNTLSALGWRLTETAQSGGHTVFEIVGPRAERDAR